MRHVFAWIARLIFIGLLIYVGYRWGMPLYRQYFVPKKVEAYIPATTVSKGSFTVSFHERGQLNAEHSVFVATPIQGKILKIIADGATVKKGDVIADLDITDLVRDVSTQELNYQNALADVSRAKSDLDILKAEDANELAQSQLDLDLPALNSNA